MSDTSLVWLYLAQYYSEVVTRPLHIIYYTVYRLLLLQYVIDVSHQHTPSDSSVSSASR